MKKLLVAICFLLSQQAFAFDFQSNQLNPQVKAQLSDKPLTNEEVFQGAKKTEILYTSCLTETSDSIKKMFANADPTVVYQTVSGACEYPEDLFMIYNILLVSSQMHQPMSEKQAGEIIDKNYQKDGREKGNSELRTEIMKSLNILK